jgi:hypothetical protein
VSLSLVCAVKKYPLHIVTSDAFAREKLEHMKILGAKLQLVRSESGRITEKLTRDMIEAAGIVAAKTGAFWTDQMKNRDQLAAYHKMAEGAEMEKYGTEAAKADDQAVAKVYQKAGGKVYDLSAATVKRWQAIARETAWKDYAARNERCARLLGAAEKLLCAKD